jgi:ACS family hexuronate transporter-like MFS transporter
MLIFAFCVVPIVFVQYISNVWGAVALISLGAAAHQAWSANIYTTASDMFPKRAVSSVIGVGGMGGSLGGILFPFFVGWLLDRYGAIGNKTGGYNIIFIICGSAYLLAWLVMHWLTPRMKQIDMK